MITTGSPVHAHIANRLLSTIQSVHLGNDPIRIDGLLGSAVYTHVPVAISYLLQLGIHRAICTVFIRAA